MFNPAAFMRISKAKEEFKLNHPKFPLFLEAVQKSAIEEGTVIEIKVTKKTGESMMSNVKLLDSDVGLFQDLSSLMEDK